MALVLEGAKDYLRGQYGWNGKQVTVEFESRPPELARSWHVALDDGGSSAGDNRTYMLQEEFSIVVGVWRELKAIPYSDQMPSIDKLGRQVIAAFHQSYTLTTDLNTISGLPDDELGSVFESALVYEGHSGIEEFGHPEANQLIWVGRRLRFRGLRRQQKIGSIG